MPPSRSGANPSYLLADSGRLYIANEYDINKGANTRRMNTEGAQSLIKSYGSAANPVHIAKQAGILIISNYDGMITTLRDTPRALVPAHIFRVPQKFASGKRFSSLANDMRFGAPHPHATVRFSGRHVVMDSGSGMLHDLRINAFSGKIVYNSSVTLQPADGPGAAAVHPRGNVLYVVNQFSKTIIMVRSGNNVNGQLRVAGRTQIRAKGKGNVGDAAKAIRVTNDGKFLYVSMSTGGKKGVIVGFRLNGRTGAIGDRIGEWSSHGIYPRDFIIVNHFSFTQLLPVRRDPPGRVFGAVCMSVIVVVNTDSNDYFFIQRDRTSGELSNYPLLLGGKSKSPACVVQY